MLKNKDLFNGMRLVRSVGLDRIKKMQADTIAINEKEGTHEEKLPEASNIVMEFMLDAMCDSEVELKKFLASWSGIPYKQIDEYSADEFISVVEKFAQENTVEELTAFFKRVLGLITQMR